VDRTPHAEGIRAMNRIAILCFMLGTLNSCSGDDIAITHHRTVMDGYSKLPLAKRLREKFGGWSFVVHFNMPGKEKGYREWHTKVYVRDRYEVTYVQKVAFDEMNMKVLRPEGEGELYVAELRRIYKQDGQTGIKFGDLQTVIKGGDLIKLMESDFDWERAGLLLTGNAVKNIEWEKQYWNALYPKQSRAE